ncbi:MAG: glycosyl hydrolase-related protein, partial [Defluviitaleaceae bacterium]|nr:glycosyl hydrolase-related protein [Defluviitaleaceae bacterium]
YGFGDGGGGPTRDMLECHRMLADMPGIPYTKTSHVEPYLKLLAKELEGKTLETHDGELYFELHRGTYTSQAYSKKANRVMEHLLHDAELVNMLRDLKQGTTDYPRAVLDEIWERVLLLQFHDIIPGTSIKDVYDESRADYERLIADTAGLIKNAAEDINAGFDLRRDSVVVYNTLPWRRCAEVFVPFSSMISEETVFTNAAGKVMGSQKADGGMLVLFEDIPSLGYKSFAVSAGDAAKASQINTDSFGSELSLDTPFYKVVFNKNGEIASLFDKEANRFVGKGALNVLQAFEDKPLMHYNAWEIDVFYKEKPYDRFVYTGFELTEHGALKTTLRRDIKFGGSDISQDITFYNHTRRIDFKTTVDWKEREVLLKAAFPLDIRALNAAYEIQYGYTERVNHSNNERDFAQFEVCAHKWADLSEGGYGAALINDCKYGYDCKDSVLRLTLLKSPVHPDKTADLGLHEFTYALYPHAGTLAESDVQAVAALFNSPAYVYEKVKGSGGNDFADFSLAAVEAAAPHVVIDTVKKAENSDAMVLRVFENGNRSENGVVIRLHEKFKIQSVEETDLMEEPLAVPGETVLAEGNAFRFNIKPFEIKTFVVTF